MEKDNVVVGYGVSDISPHSLLCQHFVVVVAQHTPEHNTVRLLQMKMLFGRNTAVWRAEKIALYQLVGLLNIVEIFLIPGAPALDVMIGMITHTVTTLENLTKNLRVPVNILTHTEESCLCIILIQKLQNLRRNLRNRTVIKSKVNILPLALKAKLTLFKERKL